MFDEKTILARLQNGEDAQTIANEFAALINSAAKTYAEEQKAAERAKVQKKESMEEILVHLRKWFKTYYDVDESGLNDLTADSVIELIDSTKEYIDAMTDLVSTFEKASALGEDTVKRAVPTGAKVVKKTAENADAVLNDFLKRMGW